MFFTPRREQPPVNIVRAKDTAADNEIYRPLRYRVWNVLIPLTKEVSKSSRVSSLKAVILHNLEDLRSEIFEILITVPLLVLYSIYSTSSQWRKGRD